MCRLFFINQLATLADKRRLARMLAQIDGPPPLEWTMIDEGAVSAYAVILPCAQPRTAGQGVSPAVHLRGGAGGSAARAQRPRRRSHAHHVHVSLTRPSPYVSAVSRGHLAPVKAM